MKPVISYILIFAIMPLLFAAVVINPAVLGCRLRGLLALGIAFTCLIAALATTIIGVKKS